MYMLRAIVVLILMVVPSSSWSLQATKDQELTQKRAEFSVCMHSEGLDSNFQIVTVDYGSDPNDESAHTQTTTHLKLKFITDKSATSTDKEQFDELLKRYQAKLKSSLAEKIFHEFVQTFELPRREACVDLEVLGAVYLVYISHNSSKLIVGEMKRDPRFFAVEIPVDSGQEFHVNGGKKSTPDVQTLTHIVEDTLTTYLTNAGRMKGTPPEITAERDYSYGYLGLNVQGVKGLVTNGFWEWMSIEVQYHNESAGAPAKINQWKFSCSLHVKYATGQHENSPYDADFVYSQQVANFRNKLVSELQNTLEKGHP